MVSRTRISSLSKAAAWRLCTSSTPITTSSILRGIAISERVSGKRGLNYFLYNPSSISKIDYRKIILTHYEWVFDNKTECVSFVTPLKWNEIIIGGAIAGNYYLNFKEYTEDTSKDINCYCLIGCIGISREIMKFKFRNNKYYLSGGTTVKMINYHLVNDSIPAALIDIGFLLDFKFFPLDNKNYNNSSIGLSIQNLGLKREGNWMPIIFRVGMNYKLFEYLSFSSDFVISDKFYINTGTEYFIKKIVYIRVGYKFFHSIAGITAGLGLRYQLKNNNDIGIDYSIEPMKELGITHKVGVNWSSKIFKESIPGQILYYKGIYHFTHNEYEEAISLWKKIPKGDPNYPKAQVRIKEAEKIIECEKEKLEKRLKELEENFKKLQEKINKQKPKKSKVKGRR